MATVAALLAAAWLSTRDAAALRVFLLVAAAWWVVALGWLTLAPQRVQGWSAGVAGVFALVPAGVALAQIRIAPGIGAALTLFTIVLIVAADTGAFFAGRSFGRVRLAPRVSPGKTWEGVLGGLLLATLVAFGGAAWFGVPVASMVPVCLAAAAFSVVGDLTESMLKRHAGVKDSGSIFPGHGGILDRIDSVTAGAPVLLLGLLQIERAAVIGVAVLGSTGTIGDNTLDVLARHPDAFRVVALGARRNVAKLAAQCRQFRPDYAALAEPDAALELERELRARGPADARARRRRRPRDHRARCRRRRT